MMISLFQLAAAAADRYPDDSVAHGTFMMACRLQGTPIDADEAWEFIQLMRWRWFRDSWQEAGGP